jgi:hypothetical protein
MVERWLACFLVSIRLFWNMTKASFSPQRWEETKTVNGCFVGDDYNKYVQYIPHTKEEKPASTLLLSSP